MNRGYGGCVQIAKFILSAVCFILLFIPFFAEAFESDLEKELQQSLIKSRAIINGAEKKLKDSASINEKITKLKEVSESVKITHALLQERFRLRQEAINQLGDKAEQRHREIEEGYLKALEEYLALIESLQDNSAQQSAVSSQLQTQQTLQSLKTLLDRILPKGKRPIFGSLPYRNLNYPAREPLSTPSIKPAYRGGNKVVSPEDTKDTPEAPLSLEIATLAQSLNWKPVAIYEYVKNEIQTEWYWGCMKGAEETLRQKSGNDCDQATLLAALLRASGFPTRYVRGTMEFFAGGRDGVPMNKAKNLTGIDEPLKIAEFFQKAGIPYKPVIQGGKITNFQIEHIWVESRIPYGNYRGTMIDDSDPTWLGLDTSIKPRGYTYNTPLELSADSVQLSAIRDEYLNEVQSVTPLEYMKLKIEDSTRQSADSYKLTRALIPENMKILPNTMQFEQKKITHEYIEIPEDLKHKVRFIAKDKNGGGLFDLQLSTFQLSNKRVALTYEPETVEDQQIIDSYGGLDNTPAYLVRLRPVLKVSGERVVVGKDGLSMGEDYNLTIDLISPNGIERITSTHITGNLAVIGIVAGKVTPSVSPLPQEGGNAEDDAETILYKEANRYIDRWNQAEDELASLMHLAVTRPIPTVVTVGGVIDVTYLLDMPHGFEWKGVFIDASLRAVSPITHNSSPITASERQKTFMQLSALQGSILENRIFEDDFQVESISTAKLIQIVSSQQSALSGQLLTIDKTNIAAALAASDLDDNIREDITNAVNQGLVVRIPSTDGLLLTAISYLDWTGIGYIKENSPTGETGYMLSGMIAGGMSVITPANWGNKDLQAILSNPNSKKSNTDPMSAFKIAKFSATDRQRATVGKRLANDLEVIVVDKNNKRVQGATVIFTAIAGNGNFGKDWLGQAKSSHETTSSINGTATAPFYVGTETGKNPGFIKLTSTDQYVTQIGINVVTVSVKSASGNLSLSPPFELYGTPDVPFEIRKVLGDGNTGLANNPTGSLVVKVVDKYGNPISNRKIRMKANSALPRYAGTTLPSDVRRIEFYDRALCINPYPLYGDCPSQTQTEAVSEYYGAISSAFFGDTVATKYSVEASDITSIQSNPLPTYFELFTTGFRASDNYIPPGVYLRYMQPVNDYGQPIDASRAGTQLKAPLTAEFVLMRDDVKLQGPTTCSSGQGTCWNLTSTGKVITEKLSNADVLFAAAQGGGTAGTTKNIGNGKYQTTYITGPTPMVNLVEAGGTATITAPKVLYSPMVTGAVVPTFGADPDGVLKPLAIKEYRTEQLQCSPTGCSLPTASVTLKGGQQALFYATEPPLAAGNEQKAKYTVYGVDVSLAMEPKVLIITDQGYSFADMKLNYTILPPEYNALMADIDLYKAALWQAYISGGKTQGTDSGTITAGSVFDANSSYVAQVILNRGSDAEIKGEKTAIPVGLIRIVDNDDGATSMQGAVTDGAAKLRLQLSVKNNREAVTGLTWQLVDPQVMDYTPASIRGGFVSGDNIVDSLPVTFNADGVAEAVYRAPETFVRWGMPQESGDKDLKERDIQPTIDIANYFKTRKDPLPPIRLKRPPVVLVHGLWGDGRQDSNKYSWKEFEPRFNEKKLYDIVSVDYHKTHADSFAANAEFVRSRGIDRALGSMTNQHFAAAKVDIIGNSMGGVLPREYCRNNSDDCSKKIRKFITTDTPHFGSELANLIQEVSLQPNQECYKLLLKVEKQGKTIWSDVPQRTLLRGGLVDLAKGSTALSRLADSTADFTYKAIAGSALSRDLAYDVSLKNMWIGLMYHCGYLPDLTYSPQLPYVAAPLFSEENDRIVSISSQRGASNENYRILGVDHLTVLGGPTTARKIQEWLDRP